LRGLCGLCLKRWMGEPCQGRRSDHNRPHLPAPMAAATMPAFPAGIRDASAAVLLGGVVGAAPVERAFRPALRAAQQEGISPWGNSMGNQHIPSASKAVIKRAFRLHAL
jgi:hypothetical protein